MTVSFYAICLIIRDMLNNCGLYAHRMTYNIQWKLFEMFIPRYLDISAIFLTDTWSIIFTCITSKQAFCACLIGLTEQQLSNVSTSAAIATIFVFLRPPATATYTSWNCLLVAFLQTVTCDYLPVWCLIGCHHSTLVVQYTLRPCLSVCLFVCLSAKSVFYTKSA